MRFVDRVVAAVFIGSFAVCSFVSHWGEFSRHNLIICCVVGDGA